MNPVDISSATRQAETLAAQGEVEQAHLTLVKAYEAGDASAAATLGYWRLAGDRIRRDFSAARQLFGRAAELGLDEADEVYTSLLASGAGGTERQWPEALSRLRRKSQRNRVAQLRLALLDQMSLTLWGDPSSVPQAQVVTTEPKVKTIAGFMTPQECRYVSAVAEPVLTPSVVVDPVTGALIRNPIRNSAAAVFPFVAEDPVLHALNRRIAAATGTTYEQGEPLQVLSYEPGQEYKLHSDALPNERNQRVMTMLVYLNSEFSGGATHFPHSGVTHRGKTGDALLSINVDAKGDPDPHARHAGLPVTGGRKLLLSKWIRAAPLDLSGPPGRPF